jgi:hypothetical protein
MPMPVCIGAVWFKLIVNYIMHFKGLISWNVLCNTPSMISRHIVQLYIGMLLCNLIITIKGQLFRM